MNKGKAISFEDSVNAYYAELMYFKGGSERPSVEELCAVSDRAAQLYLGDDATAQNVDNLSTQFSHPFSHLWTSGLLDGASYIEWALKKERVHAAEQIATLLASKRS